VNRLTMALCKSYHHPHKTESLSWSYRHLCCWSGFIRFLTLRFPPPSIPPPFHPLRRIHHFDERKDDVETLVHIGDHWKSVTDKLGPPQTDTPSQDATGHTNTWTYGRWTIVIHGTSSMNTRVTRISRK